MMGSLLQRALGAEQRRKRLQTLYLVAAAGLAALVPLILFAGFWIRAELDKSQRDVDVFSSSRAYALSQRVDGQIQQQLSALRAVSALAEIGTPAFQETATRIAAAMPNWSILSLVEGGSGEVAFTTKPQSKSVPDAALARDAATRLVPVIEARPARQGATACILLYVPVVRDRTAPYVLVTTFDAKDVQDIAAEQERQNGLVSLVIDAQGHVLARSLAPETSLGQRVGAAYGEATRGQDAGHAKAAVLEGEPAYSAFVRSPLTGWVSVVTMSPRQIERMSTRSVWATIAAGALSLVLAGILAVFIIHTVMERRVSDERLAASRALGDLDARLLATTQEALGEQRKASSEREVLLREIYHRVKNNLQIVQSLLRLGSRDLKPEQREPFESAVRRIGAMARVHTLLYNSPDLASIDFKDYLDELLKELSEGFAAEERGIDSVLEASAMRMPLDTAVPLAFIAVEILTNSFKHAFPDGRSGRITVEVHREGAEARMTIRDDGVGIPSVPSGKRRLGLTIVRKLVQQIGGHLDEPPPGTSTYVIRFPLTEPEAGSMPTPLPAEGEPAAS